jgi:hypothetical protein
VSLLIFKIESFWKERTQLRLVHPRTIAIMNAYRSRKLAPISDLVPPSFSIYVSP